MAKGEHDFLEFRRAFKRYPALRTTGGVGTQLIKPATTLISYLNLRIK